MIAILDKIKHLDAVQLVKTSMRLICFMALVAVVAVVTNTKLQTLKVNNEVYRQGFVSAEDRTRQLDCRTRKMSSWNEWFVNSVGPVMGSAESNQSIKLTIVKVKKWPKKFY